jgi:7,8-dihydroneopterin 2',3'-cyclic phosphate phosphodiesterase
MMKREQQGRRLEYLARKIKDENLRRKVIEVLKDPSFIINGQKHSGLPLEVSPAGKSNHHCYPGGYIEHVTSTTNIALAMCDSVEKVYRGKVNRDLVLAGVLLHDAFKPATYAANENGSYDSTRLGDYLDHLSIGTSELVRRGFPLELVHIVASHHGNYGPIRPHSVEALVCHLADLADSRLNGEVLRAASYFTRRTIGQELSELRSKEAFEIVRSKTSSGWNGVAKTVEKIRQRRRAHKT